jgi:hypothetical protein
MPAVAIPFACHADEVIRRLARATESPALASLSGTTLLGERAMLAGMTVPRRVSAGGGCRMLDAIDDTIALNLAREADRELLPALFEVDAFDIHNDRAIAEQVARCDAHSLVMRGRSMGLAIAAEHEARSSHASPCVELTSGLATGTHKRSRPRVIDFSALWAGPLASHLLGLAGADVIKVESRSRQDAMRGRDQQFFALLNQGKASVVVDLADPSDRRALRSLIATADIVIEASRPRALAQLGFDATELVRTIPGLVWITITGHGATGDESNWVGFGDDCGVAAGLSAALRDATGSTGFVGDAVADPLTGIFAAEAAWNAWASRRGGRLGLALSDVAEYCLTRDRRQNPEALNQQLLEWSRNIGLAFPDVHRRHIGVLPRFGEHTHSLLARAEAC